MNEIDPFDEIDNLFNEPAQDEDDNQDSTITKQK